MRRWLAVGVGMFVVVVLVPTASACSCALDDDPRDSLARADAAFIGRRIADPPTPTPSMFDSGARVDHRFRVDEDIKGNLPDEVVVRTAASGASCGLEAPVGETVAMYLERSGEIFTSGLCSQTDPARLRDAARPLPEPDGEGPPKLILGGSMGEVRTFSLDEQGRVLRYAEGPGWTSHLDVCPGSDVFVELAQGVVDREWFRTAVAVRRADTLEAVSDRRFKVFETKGGNASPHPDGIACLDPDGAAVSVWGVSDFGRFEVALVEGDDETSVYRAETTSFDVPDGGRSAFVLLDGTLTEVDLRTGTTRERGQLPASTKFFRVDPSGRYVVYSTQDGPRKDGPFLLELGSPEPIGSSIPHSGYRWLGERSFVLFGQGAVQIYDTRLRRTDGWAGWDHDGGTVVSDGFLYASSADGLYVAPLRTGPERLLRTFDFSQRFVVAGVPAPAEPVATPVPTVGPSTAPAPTPVAAREPTPTSVPRALEDDRPSRGASSAALVAAAAVLALAAAAAMKRRRAPGR